MNRENLIRCHNWLISQFPEKPHLIIYVYVWQVCRYREKERAGKSRNIKQIEQLLYVHWKRTYVLCVKKSICADVRFVSKTLYHLDQTYN